MPRGAGLVLGLLRALPWVWRLASVAMLLAALGAAYAYVRHQGYVAGFAEATARCAAEKAAQEAANRKAISEAEKRLFEVADQLSLKDMELADAIDEIDVAAAAEPGAGDQCLPALSVRRLQTIR